MESNKTSNKNKLVLPIAIILASIILGSFYYASQMNKQKSIERQQTVKIEEDRKAEEAKQQTLFQQQQKEYVAKKKNDCYQIYLKERDQYNNVEGEDYNEVRDICMVHYRNSSPQRTNDECKKIIDPNKEGNLSDETRNMIQWAYLDCLSNTFSKEF
jgi:hypothetical protein